MHHDLDPVILKTGEKAQAAVISAPDPEWAERLEKLLVHKGEPWNWQVSQALRNNIGVETRFYVLHRGGRPFSNIMTAELSGVGIFGHVFTQAEDRRKGACSELMKLLMADFRARSGKALFLTTGFGTTPYQIYASFGFTAIEAKSNCMSYCATSQEKFDAGYFAGTRAEIQPPAWTHWPASQALFLGDFPGVVRCAPLKIIGRRSTEFSFLNVLRSEQSRTDEGEPARAQVLVNTETTAVAGLAAWDWDPLWPNTCVVDIYCHPGFWGHSDKLLSALCLPAAHRYVAYADTTCPEKGRTLAAAGFKTTATFRSCAPRDKAETSFVDVFLQEKPPRPR